MILLLAGSNVDEVTGLNRNNNNMSHSSGAVTVNDSSASHEINLCSNCVFCNGPSSSFCSVCKTPYCGVECQKKDWKIHRTKCKVFIVF